MPTDMLNVPRWVLREARRWLCVQDCEILYGKPSYLCRKDKSCDDCGETSCERMRLLHAIDIALDGKSTLAWDKEPSA